VAATDIDPNVDLSMVYGELFAGCELDCGDGRGGVLFCCMMGIPSMVVLSFLSIGGSGVNAAILLSPLDCAST
jgi:hypothetical protein